MRKPTLAISCESVRQITAAYGSDAALVEAALCVCVERFGRGKNAILTSPSVVRDYLRLLLSPLEHEVFIGIFLDAQHRAITIEELFRGTLSQTSVYPREVVKRALVLNAGAVLFCHNHPSGIAEPSAADQCLTASLKQALALVDVRVLDHFIVTADHVLSFAECGRL